MDSLIAKINGIESEISAIKVVLGIGGAITAENQGMVDAFRSWEATRLQDYLKELQGSFKELQGSFKELQIKENLLLTQQQAQAQAGQEYTISYDLLMLNVMMLSFY
jgi:TolA-binding protein